MRIVFGAGAAALAAFLTACGGSEPAGSTPAGSAEATSSAEPKEYGPAVGLADDKPGLDIVSEDLKGGFIRSGYHPTALKNTNPSWGSSGLKGDADIGSASVNFTAPAGARRIGVPVAIGPTHAGLALRVLDANGKPIASFIPTDEYKQWKLWEVTLSTAAMAKLTVEATDTGAEWGQWVAFGQPRVIE
jgi:hypothetical protein